MVPLSLSDEQYAVQDLVNRKVTSSYYTSKDGVAVVRVFVKSIGRGDGVVVMDPYLGSGVLLPSNSNLIRPGKVVGIEINEEPMQPGTENPHQTLHERGGRVWGRL